MSFDMSRCLWSASLDDATDNFQDTFLILLHYDSQELGIGILCEDIELCDIQEKYNFIELACHLSDERKKDIEAHTL